MCVSATVFVPMHMHREHLRKYDPIPLKPVLISTSIDARVGTTPDAGARQQPGEKRRGQNSLRGSLSEPETSSNMDPTDFAVECYDADRLDEPSGTRPGSSARLAVMPSAVRLPPRRAGPSAMTARRRGRRTGRVGNLNGPRTAHARRAERRRRLPHAAGTGPRAPQLHRPLSADARPTSFAALPGEVPELRRRAPRPYPDVSDSD